jgi:hypothetical protein
MINSYLGDLSDEDIAVHPVAGANNIAWQIGHLTASEIGMVKEQIPSASYPQIPAALQEYASSKSAATIKSFMKKADYLDWFNKVREATITVVGTLKEADLDKATVGGMKDFCPRLGELFNLISVHDMMHGGQFTVVRRLLKKPVLF